MNRRNAFTLVELLVVIGIIAVLISILLPSLGAARRQANTVACAANLRNIVQAMHIYAGNNNGAIPGSPWTSSRLVYSNPAAATIAPGISDNNLPSVISIFDWMSPIAAVMRINFPDGPTVADRVARFEQLREFKGFRCPANEFLAPPFGTPTFKVGPMVSYNTALGFLLVRNKGANSGNALLRTVARTEFNPPLNYNVKLDRVGNSARKIYIADGGKFSTNNNLPDASLGITTSNGGAFADQGAANRFSTAWDRGLAPGNSPRVPGPHDARIFGFRHSKAVPRGAANTFKGNFAFFDGHVELLGDLEAARPEFWFPKGTELTVDTTQNYADVIRVHFQGRTFPANAPYIVP